MGHPVQFQPEAWEIYESTFKCLQSRLLMRPGEEANRVFLGCIGRALEISEGAVRIHFAAAASNHCHLILSARTAADRADFKRHLKTNLSKELGILYDWEDHLFGRRCRDLCIAPDKLDDRLMYCAAHDVKSNLVDSPRHWPGIQWVLAATEGKPMKGVWYDRTALGRARRNYDRRKNKGKKPRLQDHADEYAIELHPLPGHETWTPKQRQAWWTDLVGRALEKYPRPPDRLPLGADAILSTDPHTRPRLTKRSPAPFMHTNDRAVLKARRAAYKQFLEDRRAAIAGVLSGERTAAEFPKAGIPPSWWAAKTDPPLEAQAAA